MTLSSDNKTYSRRLFRFSLKFLLFVFIGSCAIAAWLTNRIPHCRAVEQLERINADITWMREKPNWLDRQLGAWRFDRVKSVYYCGGSQTDFSMLANLNYLEDFSNFECLEIDYSPLLKHAHSIRSFQLDPFPKNPEAFFAKFPNLEHISIQGYLDLSRLKHLTKLKSVRCWAWADAEFEHLSAFKELEYADLSNTKIKSTRSLAHLKHLETLILDGCEQLEDIVGVGQLPELKEVSLDGCIKIRDLSPVAECENLENFAFSPHGDPRHIFDSKN